MDEAQIRAIIKEEMKQGKPSIADRDFRLKLQEIISNYFGGNIFQKTEYDEEQRKYVAMTLGVLNYMTDGHPEEMPGAYSILVAHADAGISLRRKGRLEFVDVEKNGGNVGVNSTNYPHEKHGDEKHGIGKLWPF